MRTEYFAKGTTGPTVGFHGIAEFTEMIHDTGAGLYACLASVELFGMARDDLIDELDDIVTVGEFYDMAAGGQIIFT